jgi:hypothetical protein
MTPDQVRNAKPDEAAKFLDGAKGITLEHHRNALANALRHIADLERRVEQLAAIMARA